MTTFEPEHLPRRAVKRRLPRPSEIRPLLKFRQPRFDVRERRLTAALPGPTSTEDHV